MEKAYLLIILTIFSCSTRKTIKTEYSNAVNIAEFDTFIEDFEKEYIYLKDKNELWNCIKNTYSERVNSIKTKKLFLPVRVNLSFIHLNYILS